MILAADDVGVKLHGELCRFRHDLRVVAEQLDGGGVLIRRQRHDAAGLFVLIA